MNKTEGSLVVDQTAINDKLFSTAEKTRFIKLVIDISEHMFSCGGEVNRIEETIYRICTAYGVKKTDAFCITSVIIVTTIWDDGEVLTQTRRISQGARNFSKLDMLNGLSRDICSQRLSLDEVEERLEKILKRKYTSKKTACIGSIFASGGFAVFFGGDLVDAFAAAICGVIIFLIDQFVYRSKMNKVVYHVCCSFVTGVVAVVLVKLGIGHSLDKILIGCIMLLIPGINLTAAVEDVLEGDTATGALKLYESTLIACAIALGFALSLLLFKGGEFI